MKFSLILVAIATTQAAKCGEGEGVQSDCAAAAKAMSQKEDMFCCAESTAAGKTTKACALRAMDGTEAEVMGVKVSIKCGAAALAAATAATMATAFNL